MHRSGTSCLAGSLESHGLYLGDVKTSSPFNKKGNRERPDIFNFHEALFVQAGASWLNPPRTLIQPSEVINNRLLEFIDSFPRDKAWGFKDPRTIFTLHLWMPLLINYQVQLVASFRHPIAVAQSLAKRSGFSMEQGLELWLRYNQQLLEINNSFPVQLLNFNWPKEKYEKEIAALAVRLDLNPTPVGESLFYDTSLIHHQELSETPLPAEVENCYQRLLKIQFQSKYRVYAR